MRLLEAFQFTWDVRPSWQPSQDGYKTMCINSRHVLDVLGEDLDIVDIKPIHFVQLQQAMSKLGKSNGTINRITSTLSVVIGEMVKHGYLSARVPFTNLAEPRGRLEFFTPAEVEKILSAAKSSGGDDGTLHDVILAAAKTGARCGELLKLRFSAIDWDTDELTFFSTKTGDDRVLPLTPELRQMLWCRYTHRVDDVVFNITYENLRRQLKRLQKLAGVSEKKTFHCLRHYAATTMFQRGASLPDVKHVLGHRKDSTTLRYSHATDEGKRKALALL